MGILVRFLANLRTLDLNILLTTPAPSSFPWSVDVESGLQASDGKERLRWNTLGINNFGLSLTHLGEPSFGIELSGSIIPFLVSYQVQRNGLFGIGLHNFAFLHFFDKLIPQPHQVRSYGATILLLFSLLYVWKNLLINHRFLIDISVIIANRAI